MKGPVADSRRVEIVSAGIMSDERLTMPPSVEIDLRAHDKLETITETISAMRLSWVHPNDPSPAETDTDEDNLDEEIVCLQNIREAYDALQSKKFIFLLHGEAWTSWVVV